MSAHADMNVCCVRCRSYSNPGPSLLHCLLMLRCVCVCVWGGGCRGQQGVSLYTITVTLICSNTDYIHIDYIHRLYTHRLYPHTITPTCSNTDARVRARTHTGSARWSDKHHPRARETEFGTHTVSGYMYCHYISTTVNHSL